MEAVIRLTKHHGLGNDFLVAIDPPRQLTADDARSWCHRRTGIGADGLIMASPIGSDRWRMTLWNSDGSRAEISGNGLRCLAQALADADGHDRTAAHDLTIDTDAGTRSATILARPDTEGGPAADRSTDSVRIDMGKAVDGPALSERWPQFELALAHQVGVDLGNPHLVAILSPANAHSDLGQIDMAQIGPIIEADYPGGLNVHVIRVVDRQHLDMVIWERGAGITEACGSGACAAAWAANRVGLVDPRVEVMMPGGVATVELVGPDPGRTSGAQPGQVILEGPAVRIAELIVDR